MSAFSPAGAVLALMSGLTAGWQFVPPDDSYTSKTTDRVIAWSADDRAVAIRRGTESSQEFINEESGEKQSRTVEAITIRVVQCGGSELRSFDVTGKEYQPEHRTRVWQEAESWLLEQGYRFVVGTKKVDPPTVKTGPIGSPAAKETVGTIPLPLAWLPKGARAAHLELRVVEPKISTAKPVSMLTLVVHGEEPDQKHEKVLRTDLALESETGDRFTPVSHHYSRDAACLVVLMSAKGKVDSTVARFMALDTEEIRNALAEVTWGE